MTPRASASQVGDDHIRTAVSAGKGVRVVGHFASDETTLHMPRLPAGNAAQKAEAQRQEAAVALGASRWVADYGMVRAHGCTGKRCRKRAHKGDLGVMRELLDMLGLRGAP
jgi:hypothetical protein